MAEKLNRLQIAENAIIHDTIPAMRGSMEANRTFELPPRLYAVMVGCFLGFLAVTAVGFSSPGLVIPMAIFVFFILAGFGVPAIWTRIAPEPAGKALRWAKFRREGIATLTGRNTSFQATVQVLILPVLVLAWGVAVVIIAALVR